MREKGMTEEAIAAAFFVDVKVVKQRLRLASVSSVLHDVYAEDGMTLEQLMGFTVTRTTPVRNRSGMRSRIAGRKNLADPPHVDRDSGACLGQAGAIRRRRNL